MSNPSIKKNYIYNTLYQILNLILPLITAPYTARVFDADGVGIQSYTSSISAYFVLFAALGVSSYGMREIALHRDDVEKRSKTFWEIEWMVVCSTIICWIVYMVVFSITLSQYRLYMYALSLTIIAVVFDISWFFGGMEEFRYAITRNIIVKIIGIVVLFVFIKTKEHLLMYMILNGVISLISTMTMWMYLPKFLIKVKIDFKALKEHFKQTLIYFVPTIATSIYTILDKTMIGMITKDNYENGYYEQCTKITKMALAVVTSLNTVMGSRMSYLYAKGKMEEIKDKLKISMEFSMVLSVPLVAGIMAVAKNFVPIFFGEGYEKVVYLLYAYCPLIIVIAISNCLGGQYLTPCGYRVQSSKALIAGSICNLILNIFLIPVLNSYGAAIASVVAELVITILYVNLSKGFMNWFIIGKYIWKPVVGAGVMVCIVWLIDGFVLSVFYKLIIQIMCGIMSYVIMMIVLKEEITIQYLNKLWKTLVKKGDNNG